MPIEVRVDDFIGTKPDEFYRHNLVSFEMFNAVLTNFVPSYTLGIIPGYLTREHLEWFEEHPEVRRALHGTSHDERRPNQFPPYYTRQDVWIDLKKALAVVGPTDTYIPPHNVIDTRTCFALADLGFRRVMGGPGTDIGIDFCGLKYCHSEAPLEYGRSDELLERRSVPHLVEQSRARQVYLTLHWTWEYNIGLQNLGKYMDALCVALVKDGQADALR